MLAPSADFPEASVSVPERKPCLVAGDFFRDLEWHSRLGTKQVASSPVLLRFCSNGCETAPRAGATIRYQVSAASGNPRLFFSCGTLHFFPAYDIVPRWAQNAHVHVKAVLPFCGRCTNLSSCLVISISSRFIRLVRPSLHRDVTAIPPAQNKLPATTSSSSLHSRLVCSIIPFTTFHDSGKNLPSHYHFSRPSAFSLSLENGSISAQPVWQ
jgi:hypothetical protein